MKKNEKTEKQKILEYIENPELTTARNRMGCDENWYNCYYAVKETFSREEIESMTDKEIENILRISRNSIYIPLLYKM